MKVGLFFGSFNPIHVGHLILADQMCQLAGLDQVWLVVSPQSPFKQKSTLLHETDRLRLCELATQDNPRLWPSNVEFSLPRPSYTVDTLSELVRQFPRYHFSLIMGQDNLTGLHKWKNYEAIVRHYPILVYPRPGAEAPAQTFDTVQMVDAPLMDISSTHIRQLLAQGQGVQYMVPAPVLNYIYSRHLYGT